MNCLFLALVLAAAGEVQSDIEDDQEVVFYPTCAALDRDGTTWTILIHGCIYEPERDSIKRALLLRLLEKDLDLERGETETRIFEERARVFLVDNKRGKKISIQFGPRVFAAGESAPSGHFHATLRLTVRELDEIVGREAPRDGWLHFRAVTRKGDDRVFEGSVQLVAPKGISVVSDIDDTMKVTGVRDRKTLAKNTFLREFEAVPGMPALYAEWAKAGVRFHYVSASPWQLYGALEGFFGAAGFPRGSFHLKDFRWKDASFFSLFESPEKMKPASIEPLLEAFPARKFVLVGDSGEKDPEIYGKLARKYPEQVVRIFIRNVTEEPAEGERFTKAFLDVPKEKWKVFTRPEEIRGLLPRLPE